MPPSWRAEVALLDGGPLFRPGAGLPQLLLDAVNLGDGLQQPGGKPLPIWSASRSLRRACAQHAAKVTPGFLAAWVPEMKLGIAPKDATQAPEHML